ncbi:MAG: rRNA maturation RNase YbeY [Planctomycetes bacterium]|nr:rRNA maturation RNase YbeY [Planctomycetota bacterium]
MPLVIEIANKCRARADAALIKRAAAAALGSGDIELSIALIGPGAMRAFNKRVLGHDYTTDVISFDHGEGPRGERLLELVICPSYARMQAAALKIPATQELARYVVHGCLHLSGYDDTSEAKAASMWLLQEKMMRKLFGRVYQSAGGSRAAGAASSRAARRRNSRPLSPNS